MEWGWGRRGRTATNELLERQAFKYAGCVCAGGWEASSPLHRSLQNCSRQNPQVNGTGDMPFQFQSRSTGMVCCKTPYKIHRSATGILQPFAPLPKACVKHCCFSSRLLANEAFYFSYMYFLAFIGLRRECKSQHTKCVSLIPVWFLKRTINPMLCKRCLHFIYTVDFFFPPLSLMAGQMLFVILLRCYAICLYFLCDKF